MQRREGPCGEWLERDGDLVRIGYGKRALEPIGEVFWAGLPQVGATLQKGDVAVVFESAKAATDCESPLSGCVVDVNLSLQSSPAQLNESPEQVWVYALKGISEGEWEALPELE